MASPDQNKPGGKPGQRNRKAEQRRNKKPDQPPSPAPDRQQEPEQRIDMAVASAEKQIDTAVAPSEPTSIGAAAPADTLPIGLHTIATAYGDYTRKSLEETRSFVQKLSEARSLDKAVEAQTEFAKQAYETFVAESQKMRELYGKLARQTLKPLEGFVTKSTPTPR
jgi:phasin family protein